MPLLSSVFPLDFRKKPQVLSKIHQGLRNGPADPCLEPLHAALFIFKVADLLVVWEQTKVPLL